MLLRKIVIIILFVTIALTLGCQNKTSTEGRHLTEGDVVRALKNEGFKLNKEGLDNSDKYALGDTKPSLFKLNKTNDSLFLYVFNTLSDRKEIYSHGFREKKIQNIFEDFVNEKLYAPLVYNAKNVILVYIPNDLFGQQVQNNAHNLGTLAFYTLNDSKQIRFEGKGDNWEGYLLIEYYQHFIQEEKSNKIHYDNYHKETGELRYIGEEDIESIRNIKYTIKGSSSSSGGSLEKLRDNGILSLGTSGGNGAIPRIKEIFTLTIQWNDKEETFELKETNTD